MKLGSLSMNNPATQKKRSMLPDQAAAKIHAIIHDTFGSLSPSISVFAGHLCPSLPSCLATLSEAQPVQV